MGDIARPNQAQQGVYYQHPNYNGQQMQQSQQQQPPQQQQPLPLQPSQQQQPLPLQPSQQQMAQPQGYGTQMPQQPMPTFQQGWGFQNEFPTSTPQAPPRQIISEPKQKKRALEVEVEEEEEYYPHTTSSRGRGRGRGGRGGHLWGWVRLAYYKSRPTFPSCLAHRKAECNQCFEWVGN